MNSAALHIESGKRNFGLDLIRGGGILLIVLYHSLQLLAPWFPKIWIFGFPAFYAMEFFFVLSGFLVGGILLQHYLSAERFGLRETFQFMIRRWLRTLPNYYLFLILIFLIAETGGQAGLPLHPWTYFLFLQNFNGLAPVFFPESWSLALEEWFYLLLPLAVLLFQLVPGTKMKREIKFLLLCIAGIISCTVYRIYGVLHLHPDFEFGLHKIVVYRLDAPLYGVIMAWAWKFRKEKILLRKHLLGCSGLVLLLIAILLHKAHVPAALRDILLWPLASAGLSLLLPWFIRMPEPVKWLNSCIRFFSRISYSLYLLHLSVVLFAIILPVFHPATIAQAILAAIAYFMLSVTLAAINYRIFEKPILRWRDRRFPD